MAVCTSALEQLAALTVCACAPRGELKKIANNSHLVILNILVIDALLPQERTLRGVRYISYAEQNEP
jgi:hypothetical protein